MALLSLSFVNFQITDHETGRGRGMASPLISPILGIPPPVLARCGGGPARGSGTRPAAGGRGLAVPAPPLKAICIWEDQDFYKIR